MKKVKVLLSAVAAFAIIGGAVASKARLGNTIYVPDPAQQNKCRLAQVNKLIVPTGATKVHATISPADTCPLVFTAPDGN